METPSVRAVREFMSKVPDTDVHAWPMSLAPFILVGKLELGVFSQLREEIEAEGTRQSGKGSGFCVSLRAGCVQR